MTLQRYRVSMNNWPGAPGVMTFYFGTAVTDFTPVKTFVTALLGNFPTGLTLSYPTTTDLFNEATGQLTGTAVATTLTTSTATGTAAAYSGTSGALVRWQTGLINNGKRVAGRTYVVPLTGSSYDTNGSLASTTITTIQTAANTMITSFGSDMKVWSRPTPTLAGVQAIVISAVVPDLAVVLRSRRV